MADLNRREFVKATAASVALVVLGSPAFPQPIPAATGPLDVGTPADYPAGMVSTKHATQGVLIVHKDDRIYAMSSRCTHKGALISVENNDIKCNRHHSNFDITGTPTAGPAKTQLPHYAITLNDSGHLMVDMSKHVSPDDASASVTAKTA
jgi:nitrite reductase/ring-hydroxylating ferredoxin subunit